MSLPEPFYEADGVTLYHGDCREILPLLRGVGASAAIADPPYGDTSLDWDVRGDEWLALVGGVLAPDGSLWCFGSLRMFMAQAAAFTGAGWKLAQDVVWEKHNGSSFHADRFKRVHEFAVQFYPASRPWADIYKSPVMTHDATARTMRRKQRPPHTGQIEASSYASEDGGPRLMRSVIPVRSCHGIAEHPTQKPVGIVAPLIEYSAPRGALVIDPFNGSGTTLLAARDAGRRAIGIEISGDYCEIAARRLSQRVLAL